MWGEGSGGWIGAEFGDCAVVALGWGGCEDAGSGGVVVVVGLAAGVVGVVLVVLVVALVAGGGADVAACGPQAARVRAGAQASTRMAAGRASRMRRDVSKLRVPGWHLPRSLRISRHAASMRASLLCSGTEASQNWAQPGQAHRSTGRALEKNRTYGASGRFYAVLCSTGSLGAGHTGPMGHDGPFSRGRGVGAAGGLVIVSSTCSPGSCPGRCIDRWWSRFGS